MAKIFAYILTLFILLQVSTNVFISVYYVWNKAYIASELCENKDKPKLKCEGKCYLKKMLQKVSSPLQSEETNKGGICGLMKFKNLVLFVEYFKVDYPQRYFSFFWNEKIKPLFFEEQNYFYQPSFSVFHPPRIV